MPIYEYLCQRCEKVSDFFLKVSDPHPETCPKCGTQGPMKKQISQTSFALKGDGWYVTDYKPGAKEAPGASAGGVSESAGGASSVAGSESKNSEAASASDTKSVAASSGQSSAPKSSGQDSVKKTDSKSAGVSISKD